MSKYEELHQCVRRYLITHDTGIRKDYYAALTDLRQSLKQVEAELYTLHSDGVKEYDNDLEVSDTVGSNKGLRREIGSVGSGNAGGLSGS